MLYSENGKVIYCISPDYLYAIDKESKSYGFSIQGYSTLRSGVERLYSTNIKDIYGFMYVSDYLPSDTRNLDILIKKIEVMIPSNENKILLLVVRDKDGLLEYVNRISKGKLKVLYLTGFDAFNDIIFRQSFGTILAQNVSEYLEDDKLHEYKNKSIDYLFYENLFDRRLTDVLSPVRIYKTQKDTVVRDEVLEEFSNRSSIYYKLRKCYILAHFGKYIDISPIIKEADVEIQIPLKVIASEIGRVLANYNSRGGINNE